MHKNKEMAIYASLAKSATILANILNYSIILVFKKNKKYFLLKLLILA
jgi:hypothetical protein